MKSNGGFRFIRFQKGNQIKYGVVDGDRVTTINPHPFAKFKTEKSLSLSDIKILAPCRPSKIICVGLNYTDHAKELGMEIPDEPIIFMKPSTSIIGPEDRIVHPKGVSQLDFEAELGIVIKDSIRDVSQSDALNHILGYTCFNDVTARDIQKRDGQWTRAKSFDTFSPIGPCIVSGINPNELKIESLLNKATRQSSNTRHFIFKVDRLVSFISQVMTLLPGDVIATGTPNGVGPMTSGDIIEIQIEGIGTLRNYVQ